MPWTRRKPPQGRLAGRRSMAGIALLLFAAGCSGTGSGPVGERETIDILVAGGTVVTMDAGGKTLADGAVAIRGDRIVAVGPAAELSRNYGAKQTVDAEGGIILPGLVNTHNHAPMVLFRGIADDLALMEWLRGYIFPAEARNVTAEFVEHGTALACLEMIRGGTTTYADMYYFEDRMAEVTERAGMRAVLGETIIGFPAPDNKTPEEALAYTERFIQRWKGNPLITPAVAPHAPYTNSAETLKASRALADRYGVPLTLHVAETQDEIREIREKYGRTPVQWLEDLGVLGPRVLINHAVWVTEEDMAILRRHDVKVSHNPESNMKLASGTAPVVRMLSLGITVGLGTDGAASNNNLDMFQAMDFAAKLHKLASMNPTALPAQEVLRMATVGGARALGLDAEIGSLEAGKKADLIVVRTGGAHSVPMYNPYSHLVYAARGGDVESVIINGKPVMLRGQVLTLDAGAVLAKAVEIQRQVLASVKN